MGAGGRRADVVILSALPLEHRAMVDALREISAYGQWGADECVALIGAHRIVALSLSTMGNVGAAAGTQLVIDKWRPAYVILGGIAAGAAGGQLKLGDVVIAETVVGYEPGKYDEQGLRRRPDVYRSVFALLATAKAVTAGEWAPFVPIGSPEVGAGAPESHFGPVLSGEKVLADALVFDQLRRDWPTAVGLEMEGLGVATAAHRNGTGFLLVKGVSDFADNGKNDLWRDYAAHAAARFVGAVLRRLPTRGDDDDPRRPMAAAAQLFRLSDPNASPCRIAAIAGSIYRTRGADMWVNSENTDMEMARITEFTISGIIRYWGARRDETGNVIHDVIAEELAARVGRRPVAPGTVISTGSGALVDSHGVRRIIHVAAVIGEPGAGFRQVLNIASCVDNLLAEADRLARTDTALRVLLCPLLGVGTGGGPVATTVATMVDTFVGFLSAHPQTPLRELRILGFNSAEWRILTAALATSPDLVPVGEA